MRPSRWPVWFSLAWGVGGLAVLAIHLAFGVVWCSFWFGLAAFYWGAGHRYPRFRPLPPAAQLGMLGMAKDEVEGPPTSPGYLLIIFATVWLCVMLAPLMIPSTSLLPFAIPVALTLGGFAYWLSRRQRESAQVARVLLDGSRGDVTVAAGTIAGPEGGLRRHLFWFSVAGQRHGTTTVEDVDGSRVEVATMTATAMTHGFRQEDRQDLELESAQGPVHIETAGAAWAAERRPLPVAPVLRAGRPYSPRHTMVTTFVGKARVWEEELIGTGTRVLVAGKYDEAQRRISSSGGQPVVLFGVGRDGDPHAALRREWLRRQWPIWAQLLLGLIALVAAAVH